MTRYVMLVDLRCCVGCQTCTAACKLANGTPPGVQWRRVLDIESGEYPHLKMLDRQRSCTRRTLAGDKGYDQDEFVAASGRFVRSHLSFRALK